MDVLPSSIDVLTPSHRSRRHRWLEGKDVGTLIPCLSSTFGSSVPSALSGTFRCSDGLALYRPLKL
jgi:hypothetical protein